MISLPAGVRAVSTATRRAQPPAAVAVTFTAGRPKTSSFRGRRLCGANELRRLHDRLLPRESEPHRLRGGKLAEADSVCCPLARHAHRRPRVDRKAAEMAVEPRLAGGHHRRGVGGGKARRRVSVVADPERLRPGEGGVRARCLVDPEGEVAAALHHQNRRRDSLEVRERRPLVRQQSKSRQVGRRERPRPEGLERRCEHSRWDLREEAGDGARLREILRNEGGVEICPRLARLGGRKRHSGDDAFQTAPPP